METVNFRLTYQTIIAETGEIKNRNKNFKDIPSTMSKEEVKLFARIFCYVNKMTFVKVTMNIEMHESKEEKDLFSSASNLQNFGALFSFLNEEQSAPTKSAPKKKKTTPTNKASVSKTSPSVNQKGELLPESHLSYEENNLSSIPQPKVVNTNASKDPKPMEDSILKEKLLIPKPITTHKKKTYKQNTKKKTNPSLEINNKVETSEDMDFSTAFNDILQDKNAASFIQGEIRNGNKEIMHSVLKKASAK